MLTNIGIYARVVARNTRITARSGSLKQAGLRFNSTAAKSTDITWANYFKLKKQNSVINTGASVFTGLGGGFVALSYLGNIQFDVETPIFGLDPLMVLGGAIFLGAGVGWMLGPFVGTAIFRLTNQSAMKQFRIKDKEFLSRVRANRVDPSSQSFSNPVPDYYGERIYSLKDYKQWLRDCNAFRRKAKEFV
ncbi:mitochondrial import protein Pam17 [Scheffersomyces xylosifermentans]|uniref:mitochondrial import protein Pam17 n=1 Tax=Scheffersomyces xylosifermentans TaxID=1304137 RepID=UPI00315C8C03